ncbi:ABC transporter ATP-binding protein [Nocardioides sp. WV_118_6]
MIATDYAIRAAGLSRTFPGPPDVTVLHECDLALEVGEFAAVVGTSGSGKSTLLNLLGLLDRPSAGELVLGDIDVSRLDERGRTAVRGTHLGFVFQAFHLLNDRPARESVMLAGLYSGQGRRHRQSAACDALVEVGLEHRMEAHPRTMSGGERQRVAIARALANDPTLLLCDEPTGNLDTANSEVVLDLLKRVNMRGRTVLVVTHDPLVARQADRVFVMSDGRLTER